MSLATLVELCRTIGAAIPSWTQGSGSNISWKGTVGGRRYLWVKASGIRLDAVSSSAGLVKVALDDCRSGLARIAGDGEYAEVEYAVSLKAVAGAALAAPSMETGFHVLLPRRWVCHFHSLPAIVMAHVHAGQERVLRAWFDSIGWPCPAWIPAIRPGWKLSQRLAEEPSDTTVFLLQNHGVILHGDDSALVEKWRDVEARFCQAWGLDLGSATVERGDDAGPLRLYFPDAAVFLDRLHAILANCGDGTWALRQPMTATVAVDWDAAELWAATRWLHQVCPELEELPASISAAVAELPTEQLRRIRRT